MLAREPGARARAHRHSRPRHRAISCSLPLTGCAAARRGAQLGARVVLLEAESIGWGASSRSGGMCHPGFKWGPAELMERHGAILGESIYRESVDAFEWTAETIREEGIEAAFVRCGHLQLAAAPSHLEYLATAAASLATVGEVARTVRAPELRDEIGTEAYAGALAWSDPGGSTRPGTSRAWPPRPSGPAPRSTRACGRSGFGCRRTGAR